MSSPVSHHSDSGDLGRARSPLFAPPSTATTPTAATAADLYADNDSNYDMLDDDIDLQHHQPAAPGPGPATLANRGHKRTASPPPRPPRSSAKKHKQARPSGSSAASGSTTYLPPPLPHYTVVRSSHNSKQSPHRIIINQGVSDANPDRWPPEEEYSPSRKLDGKENWYERTPKDTGRHKAFRDKVGEELAKTLKLSQPPNEFWTLDALPDNYLFTVHHTMGGGKPRTDVYVWGCPKVLKFRTANEMTPHIHWLLVHGPNDTIACQCKYCAKMTQGDVNRQLGLPLKQTGAAASSSPARGSSPASMGPRVKNPVNYRPSPLALAGGSSGPPSTSSSSGYGYGNAARVASFNDPGGDRLLGPNATPAAIAKAKRRHAKEMDEVGCGGVKKNKGNKGKGKEREKEKKKEKKKQKKLKGLFKSGGQGIGSTESDEYGGDSSDLSDLGDTTDDVDIVGGPDAAAYEGGYGSEYGPSYRGAFTNRMRDEDLERAAAPRRGELVWAELPRPLYGIQGGRLDGKVVMHWPGIVEGREIRNEAVMVVVGEAQATEAGKGKVAVDEGERGVDGMDGVEIEEGGVENATATTTTTAAAAAGAVAIPARPGTAFCLAPPPRLKTIPSTRYSVRLLAVADTIRHLGEDQVVPWIGHAGPRSLFEGFDEVLQDREAVKHIWDGKGFVRDTLLFDDGDDGDGGEPEKESQGQDAGSRAAAAVVGAPKTLDEALIPLGLAMQIASELMATFTLNDRYNVTARFLTPVDPTDPVHLQEREKQLRSWAFQSTHFGAELVWTGDFVRLFEPEGNAFEGIKYDSPPTSVGQRALFMKVFAIYKVNSAVDEPGLIKLAGELWELRDFGSTSTTTTTTAPTIAQAGDGDAAPHTDTSGNGAELTVAGDAVTAADGQSAMSIFEKRPSPVRVNGPASSSTTLAVIAGTPSTPPDTPPARGAVPFAAAAAAAAVTGAEEDPARDYAAKVSPTATFDPEALNLPPPPAGFYWFRLTNSTDQVHTSIDFLAGRYHPLPKELNSPAKIRETLERLDQSTGDDVIDGDMRAMLLAGLGPAYKLFNRCGIYVGDRRMALVRATLEAEKEARPRLEGMAAAGVAPVQDDLLEEGPAPTAGAA